MSWEPTMMTAGDVQTWDKISFGDHTGTYRVLTVRKRRGIVTLHSLLRRKRRAPAETAVWRY